MWQRRKEYNMPRKMNTPKKKSGRRGNNEGSIYRRKDGKWCGQVTVGYHENGKQIRKTTYGSSRQEVAKKLAQLTNEVFENGYSSFSSNDTIRLYPLMEDWYFTFKEPVIGSVTSEKLRSYMKNHIKPELGNIDAPQIDLLKMQKFFNGLAKKGLCLETVKHIKQILNQFYVQYLIKKGIVKENPIDSVIIRTVERDDTEKEKMALSPELRTEVMSKLKDEHILNPILTTLMLTGMRPGELIALRWRDVDLKNAQISIRLAAGREIEFDDEGNVTKRRQVITNTKTVLSVRSFKVASSVVICLNAWLAYQKEQQAKKGIDFTSGDCHVFCTKKGTMRTYYGLRSLLVRFLAKNNLDEHGISLYTFRHTFATMLLEERENPKIVSELMGHAKVLTTLSIYSHVVSKSVYEDTALTLDRAYMNALAGNEKADVSCDDTPTLLPTVA